MSSSSRPHGPHPSVDTRPRRARHAVSKATLVARLVALARSEVGTREGGGNNRGIRIEEYQQATWLTRGSWPWCTAFTCWLMREWARDRAVRA
jgi:hypothetical protein